MALGTPNVVTFTCAGYVPLVDKFGKRCYLLLSPEDTYFIVTENLSDGVEVVVRLPNVGVTRGSGRQ